MVDTPFQVEAKDLQPSLTSNRELVRCRTMDDKQKLIDELRLKLRWLAETDELTEEQKQQLLQKAFEIIAEDELQGADR